MHAAGLLSNFPQKCERDSRYSASASFRIRISRLQSVLSTETAHLYVLGILPVRWLELRLTPLYMQVVELDTYLKYGLTEEHEERLHQARKASAPCWAPLTEEQAKWEALLADAKERASNRTVYSDDEQQSESSENEAESWEDEVMSAWNESSSGEDNLEPLDHESGSESGGDEPDSCQQVLGQQATDVAQSDEL